MKSFLDFDLRFSFAESQKKKFRLFFFSLFFFSFYSFLGKRNAKFSGQIELNLDTLFETFQFRFPEEDQQQHSKFFVF